MQNTKNHNREQLEGVDLADVPALLEPWDISRAEGDAFQRKRGHVPALLTWDDRSEQWDHTRAGSELVERIRTKHRITLSTDLGGGPRWYLGGEPISTGTTLEILRRNGTWMAVRFEIAWNASDAKSYDAGGRAPRLFVGLAGGCQLAGVPDGLDFAVCRWPGTSGWPGRDNLA